MSKEAETTRLAPPSAPLKGEVVDKGGAASPTQGQPTQATLTNGPSPTDGPVVRTQLASRGHIAIGSNVGRYRILSSAGKGGMGNVLVAHDTVLNRTVAVKLLHVQGPDAYAWLVREAQAMARVRHPNVVTVYDFGDFRDNFFITMEYVEGGTLRTWMQSPHSISEVIAIFTGAGRGLAAAHKVGLAHLDFKPANVLIDGITAEPRVTDFGIAHTTNADGEASPSMRSATLPVTDEKDSLDLLRTPLSPAGTLMGTPRYMAPEQHRGESADARADQFAFSVALFEAVTGNRPFQGEESDEILASIERGPGDVDALRRVPPWLLPVLLRGLRFDPADRYPSMDALLAELAKNPAPRRRRQMIVAGALAIVGAAIAVYVERDRARVEACHVESNAVASAWNAELRDRARTAFAKSGAVGWQKLWDGASVAMDAYARTWTQSAYDACSAATVERTQNQNVYLRRQSCLHNRLAEVSELGRLFASADTKLVQRAPNVVASLSPLETCADVDALLAPGSTADDPTVEKRVAELRSVVAEAKTLREAERQEAALDKIAPVLEEARRIGFTPLIAEALVIEGRSTSQAAEARERLVEAYRLGISSRRFITAGQAGRTLTDLEGHTLSHHKEGHFWARLAEAALAGANSIEADDLRVQILVYEVYIYNEEGIAEPALEAARRSLEIAGKRHPGDERAFEQPHIALGVASLTAGDADTARREFEIALGIATRVYGPEHPRVADRLSDLATIEIADRNYEVALGELGRALEVNLRARGPDHLNHGVYLLNRSEALTALGRYEEALRDIAESKRVYEARLGPETADIAILEMRAAICHRALGHPVEAMTAILRAEKISAAAGDAQPNQIAEMRFAHAQILGDAKTNDAQAALLARQALDYYIALKPEQLTRSDRVRRSEIERWLGARIALR